MGSTNYGKLTNVSFQFGSSVNAQTAAAASGTLAAPGTLASSGAPIAQIYETIIVGVNHNIVRISGGALGFPIL